MRKSPLLLFVLALSFLIVSPLSAQDSRARRRRAPDPPPSTEGQAEPRRAPDPPQRRQGQERERARPRKDQYPERAVPRARQHPRPHPQYGPYNRMEHGGRYYYWRPYPRVWRRPNICVAGYWEWDSWIGGWVWIKGYCNVRGHRPGPGFHFWFDFGR